MEYGGGQFGITWRKMQARKLLHSEIGSYLQHIPAAPLPKHWISIKR